MWIYDLIYLTCSLLSTRMTQSLLVKASPLPFSFPQSVMGLKIDLKRKVLVVSQTMVPKHSE